jgi:hypothetical protein
MTEQDRFDEFVEHAAPDYNRPPAGVPRDAMWARIEAAQRAHRDQATVVPLRPRGVSRWVVYVSAAAAVLIVGVALGRWSTGGGTGPAEVATAVAPAAGTAARPNPRELSPAYQLAVAEHLSRTETLLTAFRADVRAGRATDAQLASWAKELLTTTRMLSDSPAAADPKVKRLLDDLELVLAQMAQLSKSPSQLDMDLIDHAMSERSMMPRLRTAIPAGRFSAGT